MLSELLLSARDISKIYTSTANPIARLRQALFRVPPRDGEVYEVLRNVDLDVFRGETVGIMGLNGAGKTTLLGILGNAIEPSSGEIVRNARIATLLELSAGFNRNFTGRENSYLFCGIHGIPKKTAEERMSAIADFAGLGKYFDLPLRTYSSGMQARLAFACAVHVDAELIIVDETLAVGDASFRVKCYDKIKSMQGSGKTFLLVSHNPNLIANFCTRGIVLEKGRKLFDGSTFTAVEAYKTIRVNAEMSSHIGVSRVANQAILPRLNEKLSLSNFCFKEQIDPDQGRIGIVESQLNAREDVHYPAMSFGIRNDQGIVICSYDTSTNCDRFPSLLEGHSMTVQMEFVNLLLPGTYFISASTYESIGDVKVQTSLHSNVLRFDVAKTAKTAGLVDLNLRISVK